MKRRRERTVLEEQPRKRSRLGGGVVVAKRTGGKRMGYEYAYPPSPSLTYALNQKGKGQDCYILEIEEDGSEREIFRWNNDAKEWQQLWSVPHAEARVQQILEESDADDIQADLVKMIQESEHRLWQWARWTVAEVLIRYLANAERHAITPALKEAFEKLDPTNMPPWEE